MFCANCGTQLDEGTKFCTNCGAKTDSAQGAGPVQNVAVETPNPFANRNLRHGFTSFYLWLCVFLYIAGALTFLIDFFLLENEIRGLLYPYLSDFNVWVLIIASVLYAYAYKELINWRKAGFWMIIGLTVIMLIMNPTNINFNIYSVIGTVFPVGILFGVLQFKNAYNAKSTWEQLWG